MPTVNPPRLQSYLAKLPKEVAEPLSQAMSAQDRHAQDLATALNKALVVGDTLLVSQPYTAASPLSVPSAALFANGYPYASYTTAAAQSIASGSLTVVNFDTKEVDTDSAVATGAAWAFTVPTGKAGLYQVDANVSIATGGSSFEFHASIVKGVAETRRGSRIAGVATSVSNASHVSACLNLVVGDVLKIAVLHNAGVNKTLDATGIANYVSITGVNLTAPVAPSCFPFLVSWPKAYAPTLVLTQAQDVTTPSSPSKLDMGLPDWTLTTSSTQSFINIRNIPGLLAGTSYAVQVIAF